MTIKTIHFHWFLFATICLVSSNTEIVCKVQRSTCIVHDPITIKNVSCWARPTNRTTSVMNVRGDLVRPLDKVVINIQLFQKRNLKYQQYLVNVTEDYCQFFASGRGGSYIRFLTDIYLNYTNLNHICPYTGHVYITDLPLGPNNLPRFWPKGEFRLDILAVANNKRLITIQLFVEVTDKLMLRP